MSAQDTLSAIVSRETFRRLEIYEHLLRRWNPAINLVSRASLDTLWERHFLDSAQLWALRPTESRHWADFGTGGGFPGLVIAILAAHDAPEMDVTLVEADARKSAFLATVARETGTSARIITERAERVAPIGADVASARALAPLGKLLDWVAPHLAPGGIALFPKGADADREIEAALALRPFTVQKIPSQTDPRGVILSIGGLNP